MSDQHASCRRFYQVNQEGINKNGFLRLVALVMLSIVIFAAQADLQNVQVGGEIRIRGRYWHNNYDDTAGGRSGNRIPSFFLQLRPIGATGTQSRYRFDERGSDLSYVEQKSKLEVNADFTDYVNAVIAIESYDQWGDDFRSDYVTGADFRADTGRDVEVTESFIDVANILGQPLMLRIGRQPIAIDKRWLVSDYISATLPIFFDGVRLMYRGEHWEIDGWATKLGENGANEEDGDVDFYGAHATYTFSDAFSARAYWYMVRDARSINDTNFVAPIEELENVLGLDDYDPSYLHTVGLHLTGKFMGFDYDWEGAYQFGEADAAGSGFKLDPSFYGDNHAEYDAWATDLELGFTLEDFPLKPRMLIGGAIFSGEDNRDISFWQWVNPFDRPESSLSFNRLFSGTVYSWTLDVGQDMSNFKQVRIGGEVQLTDAITANLLLAHYWVDEPFDAPKMVDAGIFKIPVAPALAFWTDKGSDDIGTTALLRLRYEYSEDLYFSAGVEYLFAGDALNDGSFLHRNGLEFTGGRANDDAQYFFFDTGLKFGGPGRGVDLHQFEYRTKK